MQRHSINAGLCGLGISRHRKAATNRRVEIEEAFLRHDCGDLRTETRAHQVFVDDQATARAFNRRQNRFAIPRHERAQIEDFDG